MTAARYFAVRALSPRGHFNRAGLRFTREPLVVELGDEDELGAPIPVVSTKTLARIQAEASGRELTASERDFHKRRGDDIPEGTIPMLLVVEATPDQVERQRTQPQKAATP